MAVWHGEKGRKPTGGEIRLARKKRKYELGNLPVYTKLGEKEKRIVVRTKGGGIKVKEIVATFANVLDKSGKMQKVKILDVLETPGNPQLARSGVIIKGAIIRTELGKAKVTSRPSQDGVINAILLEEKV
jgi:small subunit ribosomal protein S8e